MGSFHTGLCRRSVWLYPQCSSRTYSVKRRIQGGQESWSKLFSCRMGLILWIG